ncbi:OsmC family peroxiredoxin [Micromonospora sp. NPDC000668]|uniref:OsmC family peroxiredoxin n=1 Tax=Micromonospora sp. NPDC000668 TaxID=3364219 RepID=UPI0036C367E6
MTTCVANAVWCDSLSDGIGEVEVGSGFLHAPYTFASRFQDSKGCHPEELLGAAHASCFAMFLANVISEAGTPVLSVLTSAAVTLGDGPAVTGITLTVTVDAPGLEASKFTEHVETTKLGCPISKALAVPILVDAQLS